MHISRPMYTPSLAGARYFLLLVDDISQELWIYSFKEKSDVLGVLKKYKFVVEDETCRRISVLQLDIEEEYIENYFSEFARRNTITVKMTKCMLQANHFQINIE